MNLTLDIIDISTPVILLNDNDARQIGVLEGDRATITRIKTKHTITAPVSITKTLTSQGTATVSRGANDALDAKKGDEIEIRVAPRPASIAFIRKKMDGGRDVDYIKGQVHDDSLLVGKA